MVLFFVLFLSHFFLVFFFWQVWKISVFLKQEFEEKICENSLYFKIFCKRSFHLSLFLLPFPIEAIFLRSALSFKAPFWDF